MNIRPNPNWFLKGIAFSWSFVFAILFRYTLNTLYPFWANQISLSLFSYLLLSIILFAFLYYFHHHREYKKKGVFFSICILVNTSIFLTITHVLGETNYLYLIPFLFNLQLIIHLFLFTSKLPFFLSHRISLLLGFIPGILPITSLQNPWFIFLFTSLISVFPNRFLYIKQLKLANSQMRMLPLRQSLDFLKFLFLGFALLGIFDEYRSRFYIVSFILILSSIIQNIVITFDNKRHHIKIGIRVLATIFLILGILYTLLPFSYWAAIGYGILAIWEALYFNKIAEGYLKREQKLIGIAVSICLFFYFITYEWSMLLIAILISLTQVRILLYIFKKYRRVMGAIFSISFTVWLIIIYQQYNVSFTRSFWQHTSQHEKASKEIPDLYWLNFTPINASIKTDLFPREILRQSYQTHLKKLSYLNYFPVTFIFNLYYEKYFSSDQNYYIINFDQLYPYNTSLGKKFLFYFLQQENYSNVYFYRKNKINGTIIYFSYLNEKLNLDFKGLNNQQKEFTKELGTKLIKYYNKINAYSKSSIVVQQLLEILPENPEISLLAANIFGITNQANKQIEYLQNYIQQTPKDTLIQKQQLIELYFNQKNSDKAQEIISKLIKQDRNNILYYFKWLFKINKELIVRPNWFTLKQKLKATHISPAEVNLQYNKQKLLNQINQEINNATGWRKEQIKSNKQQEKIRFPK